MKLAAITHELQAQKVPLKSVGVVILGSLTLYYLHTGRRDGDFGRLFWAAILAIGSLMVLSL